MIGRQLWSTRPFYALDVSFPRWLARSNKYLANRVLIRLAGRPPFGAIRHVGRTSGHTYRIPVNVFRSGNDFVIALTYGPTADWVKNVLTAGEATVEFDGSENPVTSPRIVDRADALGVFPRWARAILRLANVSEFLRLELEQNTAESR